MRSGSTATLVPRCYQRSQRWCRGGTAPTPYSAACWTGTPYTACWQKSWALGLDLVEVRQLTRHQKSPRYATAAQHPRPAEHSPL